MHEGVFAGKHRVRIKLIRPAVNPDVDRLRFDQADIAALIEAGEVTAQAELQLRPFVTRRAV